MAELLDYVGGLCKVRGGQTVENAFRKRSPAFGGEFFFSRIRLLMGLVVKL